MTMRHWASMVAVCGLVAWAGSICHAQDEGDGTYQLSADQLDSGWNHEAGEITTRFNLDFTAVAGLGGDDGVSISDNLLIGLGAGVGYFPIAQVSADLDLSGTLSFAENSVDFTNIAITPGSHIYPISEVFLRVGLPIVVSDPTSINILGGVGYEYPLSDSQTLVGEIDLIYPLDGSGSGVITVGGGTTFSF